MAEDRMHRYYDCPVCGRHVHGSKYFPGFEKCIDCVKMVKDLRRYDDKLCTCLKLFYGRTEVPNEMRNHK